MEKIVSQLDGEGYFLAAVEAVRSPLEPGQWLIPMGAVDVEPPIQEQGKRYRLDVSDSWAEEDAPPPPQHPEVIPPPAIPQSVTRFQARAALVEAGLLEAVNAYFSALPDDDLNKLAWQEAPTVRRDSDATRVAADALGITVEQMDALFVRAGAF